jgi:hypothetical protein
MAPYFPVTVCRSDGQFETITRGGVKELNQPTKEQLDDTPDANGNVDCYKKLSEDDPKAVDWRRKLGGMLMHLVGGKEHAGMFKALIYSGSTCKQLKFVR